MISSNNIVLLKAQHPTAITQHQYAYPLLDGLRTGDKLHDKYN